MLVYSEEPTLDQLVELCKRIVDAFPASTPYAYHPVPYPYTWNYPVGLYLTDYKVQPVRLDLSEYSLVWPTRALGMYTPRCVAMHNRDGVAMVVAIYGAQYDIFRALVANQIQYCPQKLQAFLLDIYRIARHYQRVAMYQLDSLLDHPVWRRIGTINAMYALQGIHNPLSEDRFLHQPYGQYTSDFLQRYNRRLREQAVFCHGLLHSIVALVKQTRLPHRTATIELPTNTIRLITGPKGLTVSFTSKLVADVDSTFVLRADLRRDEIENQACDLINLLGLNPVPAYQLYHTVWRLVA